MVIQWCLKGVPFHPSDFNDHTVQTILSGEGIRSAWLRNVNQAITDLPVLSHANLSAQALDDHVHDYWRVSAVTPYISLTAGCTERVSAGGSVRHSALTTALEFATGCATHEGYIFLCWVLVTPKPAAELPGFAEEIRDLNTYRPYSVFHDEGEIAAKLYVPARQIRSVTRYNARLMPIRWVSNRDFAPPDRVSNVVGYV